MPDDPSEEYDPSEEFVKQYYAEFFERLENGEVDVDEAREFLAAMTSHVELLTNHLRSNEQYPNNEAQCEEIRQGIAERVDFIRRVEHHLSKQGIDWRQ